MATHCPSEETLSIWTSGGLEVTEAEEIALHVEGCERCAGRVAEEAILMAELTRGHHKDPGPEFWASFADQIMSRVDDVKPVSETHIRVVAPSPSPSVSPVRTAPVAASSALASRPRKETSPIPLWRRPAMVGLMASFACAALLWISLTPSDGIPADPAGDPLPVAMAPGPATEGVPGADLAALDSAISFLAESDDEAEEAHSPEIAPVVALLNAPLALSDDEASLDEMSNDELATLLSGLSQVRG